LNYYEEDFQHIMEVTVGAILEGTIKSITKFGAFVSLPGGRSGLVHISEIAHTYVADVKDHLTEGQSVKVKVVGIDDAGRINLSIKKATPPPRPQNFSHERHEGRSDFRSGGENGSPSHRSAQTAARASSSGGQSRIAPTPQQAPGPADFEARLKQFMQVSDSKLSDLRMTEKRSSRRSGHR